MDLFKGYLKLAYVSNRVMVRFLNGRIGSKMKRQFAIIFVVILVSCGPERKKFDRSTWNEMDDIFYANRESMVEDLMDNHLHIGMSYTELTELIVKPENYANMKPDLVAYE